MTVENTNNTISYTGNGSVTTFAYDFLIYSESHLKVYLDDVLQTTGYSVTDVGENDGGNTVFITPPDSGAVVRIDRTVPDTQLIEYQEYGPFPAKANERGLDLLTMAVQQNSRERGKLSDRVDEIESEVENNTQDISSLESDVENLYIKTSENESGINQNTNNISAINNSINNINQELDTKVSKSGDTVTGQLKGVYSQTNQSFMPQLQIIETIERAIKPFKPDDNTAEDYGYIYQTITSTADYGSIA